VDLLQDRNESPGVNGLVLRGEGFARAEFREHVVHARHRKGRGRRLPRLAVGVERLGELPNTRSRAASMGNATFPAASTTVRRSRDGPTPAENSPVALDMQNICYPLWSTYRAGAPIQNPGLRYGIRRR
jgi:hypothetical protein